MPDQISQLPTSVSDMVGNYDKTPTHFTSEIYTHVRRKIGFFPVSGLHSGVGQSLG